MAKRWQDPVAMRILPTRSYVEWNGVDDTDAIHEAIATGAGEVVLLAQAGDYVITPITLASNQKIILSPGVNIIAKSGSFTGVNDRMFYASSKTNVSIIGHGNTLTMRRDDYTAGGDYPASEGRDGIGLYNCSNVHVSGITIKDCGGDGIYMGGVGAGCSNVTISGCVLQNNLRNNMSITHATNVLVENVDLIEANGTAPEAGIDIEPNLATNKLSNIVLRNVRTSGNARCGFDIYLNALNSTSDDINILIEDCSSTGDGTVGIPHAPGGLRLLMANASQPGGSVTVNRLTITNAVTSGMLLGDKTATGPTVEFHDCTIINPDSIAAGRYPVWLAMAVTSTVPISGFVFDNLTITDGVSRNPIDSYNGPVPDIGIHDITGTITLNTVAIPLTEATLQGWMAEYTDIPA